MGNEYILTESGELYHHGILGMRWGVRRYQNKDGSLTKAGRKHYNAETEKLKEREKTIKNKESVNKKISKLADKKAELDAREAALKGSKSSKGPKTADTDLDETPVKKQKSPSEMSDKELKTTVERLRNEDAYNDLSKKLGHDIPKTELDAKIAEMEKQKKYLELQRDIKSLTPEKVSFGKKIAKTLMDDIIGPAATKAGKEVLEKFLKDTGMDAVGKVIGDKAKKEAAKIAKEKEKAAKKEAERAAEKEAEMQKYRDFQEAYRKSLEPDSTSSSTYRNKGGERGYVNPNESRGLSVFSRSAERVSNTPVTSLSTAVTSRGKSTVDRLSSGSMYEVLDRNGQVIRTYGDDD